MELSNKEVYTTTTRDFGKGFLFPNIDIGLTPLGATPDQDGQENDDPRRQEIPLSAAEISLAAAATPEGVDYAFTCGEFGGHSDLAAEGLGHAGIQITYLGTPAGGSLDLAGVEEEVGAESFEDARANDPAHSGVGESCPVLYPPDWDLIGDLGSEGGSISIERALRRYDAESLVRVVGAGFAVGEVAYGPHGEERMLSLTDATHREVLKAAHEEAALRAGARHLESAGERARLHTIARATLMVRGSTSNGGAATLEGVLGRLTALTRFSRAEARGEMRALVKDGSLRCRVVGGRVLLGTVAAPAPEYARAARTADRAERQSRKNSRIRTKVFADGAWIPPERESGPDPHGERVSALDAERTGEAVITTATGKVLAPSKSPRQRQAAQRRVNRAIQKGRDRERDRRQAIAAACQAAADEALRVHLRGLAPADRLELLLQVRGEQDYARLERSSRDTRQLKAAARELLGAGRISVRRDQDGTVRISATTEKPDDLGKILIQVIAREGIPVPKSTRLARRVAAHRAVLTRQANAPANARANAAA